MSPSAPSVSAVVLAYGEEEWLEDCVDSLLASTGVGVEVVVIDNGCTSDAVENVRGRGGVRVVDPGENLGYASGCNLGASVGTGEVIAFVNSDCRVAPGALAHLSRQTGEPGVAIASASLRLADEPDLLNSGGNPLHFLGLCWAGAFRESAAAYPDVREVACATGAAMALRRDVWQELGGFEERFFMYHDDVDLSWRAWQRGYRIVYVPGAVAYHHYEFSRNPRKMFLLERNRLAFLLTNWETRTLLAVLPALAMFELALLPVAVVQGWGRQKVASWAWLLSRAGWLRQRRRRVQAARTVPDRDLVRLLADRFQARNIDVPGVVAPFDALLGAYWRTCRAVLQGQPARVAVPESVGG
jgi:GT2 family glycosyltransferase